MDRKTLAQLHTRVSDTESEPSSWVSRLWIQMLFVFFLLSLLTITLVVLLQSLPPRDFPREYVYTLESGSTIRGVGNELQELGIIRSSRLFEMTLMFQKKSAVIAGDYLFASPESMFEITRRLTAGEYGAIAIRVSLPEGSTITQMAEILEEQLPQFEEQAFLRLAKDYEGYLFPDTYFFFPSTDTETVFTTLRENFMEQTESLFKEMEALGKDQQDIITMASIIEKESANNDQERKIISGILWKRIAIDMPLQVDAPFVYILGKGSSQLTREDLKEDSPYNTYTNLGLPPGPIGNPSLAAIEAALYPVDSPYLFYLHDNNGMVYYAPTHDEHVRNKNRYLR